MREHDLILTTHTQSYFHSPDKAMQNSTRWQDENKTNHLQHDFLLSRVLCCPMVGSCSLTQNRPGSLHGKSLYMTNDTVGALMKGTTGKWLHLMKTLIVTAEEDYIVLHQKCSPWSAMMGDKDSHWDSENHTQIRDSYDTHYVLSRGQHNWIQLTDCLVCFRGCLVARDPCKSCIPAVRRRLFEYGPFKNPAE